MIKRARRGEGATFAAVLQLLEDAGYQPSCLTVVTGYWLRVDCYRWEVHLKVKGERFVRCCGCWYSMTEFLKRAKKLGFHVNEDNEIWPN